MADRVDSIRELDLAALGGMRPPTADDVPIALDGTRLDTPAKLVAYLEEINAAREAANRQRPV